MAKNNSERDDIWWLANGSSSTSRQPSFASPNARLSVSYSYYSFGWHRKKGCFVTSTRHDLFALPNLKEYLCDPKVAEGILIRCSRKKVSDRFFSDQFAKEDDADIFGTAESVFGITLRKSDLVYNSLKDAEASLHFYTPDGNLQSVNFHNGMTKNFGQKIAGMKIADIRKEMSL